MVSAAGSLKALGTLTAGTGALFGSIEQSKALRSQSRDLNVQAGLQAERVLTVGRRQAGQQKAAFGAAGVEQVGTAAAAPLETIAASVKDANDILFQARKQSRALRRGAKNSVRAGAINFSGSLLQATGEFLGGG